MSLSSLLINSISLQHKVTAIDPSLGAQDTWTDDPVFNQIPASVQPATARERVLFAQKVINYNYRIYLDRDIQCTPRDRVIDNSTGHVYRILNYRNVAGRDYMWEIECTEMV